MTSDEFKALKAGDKIENPMNAYAEGVVAEVTAAGVVKVQWGPSKVEFSYAPQTTAWMHWMRIAGAVEGHGRE